MFGAQLPYTDYLIGNEAEAETLASPNGPPDAKDLPTVAEALAQQPKSNSTRDRIVAFTNCVQPTIAARFGCPDNVKT